MNFKISALDIKQEPHTITNFPTNETNYTFDEKFSMEENSKSTLTFKTLGKFDDVINPYVSLLHIGAVVHLETSEQEGFLSYIVTSVTPEFHSDNTIYTISCEDEASRLWSKRGAGMNIKCYGKTPTAIVGEILKAGNLPDAWAFEGEEKEDTLSFVVEGSTLYNALVEFGNSTEKNLKINYAGKKISYEDKTKDYRGFKLRPEVNIQSLGLSFAGDQMVNVLRVSGGTDAEGVPVSIIPELSTEIINATAGRSLYAVLPLKPSETGETYENYDVDFKAGGIGYTVPELYMVERGRGEAEKADAENAGIEIKDPAVGDVLTREEAEEFFKVGPSFFKIDRFNGGDYTGAGILSIVENFEIPSKPKLTKGEDIFDFTFKGSAGGEETAGGTGYHEVKYSGRIGLEVGDVKRYEAPSEYPLSIYFSLALSEDETKYILTMSPYFGQGEPFGLGIELKGEYQAPTTEARIRRLVSAEEVLNNTDLEIENRDQLKKIVAVNRILDNSLIDFSYFQSLGDDFPAIKDNWIYEMQWLGLRLQSLVPLQVARELDKLKIYNQIDTVISGQYFAEFDNQLRKGDSSLPAVTKSLSEKLTNLAAIYRVLGTGGEPETVVFEHFYQLIVDKMAIYYAKLAAIKRALKEQGEMFLQSEIDKARLGPIIAGAEDTCIVISKYIAGTFTNELKAFYSLNGLTAIPDNLYSLYYNWRKFRLEENNADKDLSLFDYCVKYEISESVGNVTEIGLPDYAETEFPTIYISPFHWREKLEEVDNAVSNAPAFLDLFGQNAAPILVNAPTNKIEEISDGYYSFVLKFVPTVVNLPDSLTAQVEKYTERKQELWKEFYDKYYYYIYEGEYSNTDETDSLSLYNQAITHYVGLMRPKAEYSITALDVSALAGSLMKMPEVGDTIKVYEEHIGINDNLEDTWLKSNEITVTAISRDLRKDYDISLTVNTNKYYDRLLQKLLLSIK